MSDIEYSDVQEEVQEHIAGAKKKRTITDAQRSARIENLKRGRLTRMANIAKKKEAQALKKKTKSYEVKQYTSSESSDSDSSDEELVITKKHKKVRQVAEVKQEKPRNADHQTRQEIAELRQIVLKLAKTKKKKERSSTSTVINIPQSTAAPVDDSYSNVYKSRILKL